MKHFSIFWLLLLMLLGCNNDPHSVAEPEVITSIEPTIGVEPTQQPEGADLAESESYREAYSLLFDRESRAKKAIDLLIAGESIDSLCEKELNLLCWAYNELGDSDKQLKASQRLWELFPNGETSTHWMCGSLFNKHAYSQNTEPIFEFISDAMAGELGNTRDLLTLKASALVAAGDQVMTDAERRIEVSDLLVKAYCAGPPSSGRFRSKDVRIHDSPIFLCSEHPFRDYFTSTERDVLALRMKQAKSKGDIGRE